MLNSIFNKKDLRLLLSALAFYVEHSSLKASCDFDNAYLYTRDIDFDNHLKFLSHCRDLQNCLIEILNNFD